MAAGTSVSWFFWMLSSSRLGLQRLTIINLKSSLMVKGLSRRLSDDTRNFLIENVFFKISHLSENREVGRLESRLLFSDNE